MGTDSVTSILPPARWLSALTASRTYTLRTNFLWNAAGSGAFVLSQWLVMVIFAKLGSPTLLGRVVFGLALITPLFVVASFQLRMIQSTDSEHRYTVGQYLGLRTSTTIVAMLAAGVIAVVLRMAGSAVGMIVIAWALSKCADAGSDSLYGLFQQRERMDYVGLSLTIRGGAAIVAVAALFIVSHSVLLSLAGIVIGWTAVLFLFDVPMARVLLKQQQDPRESLRPVLSSRKLWPLCAETAPLAVVAFLLAIQTQVPRYVVASLFHERELGLFSAAAYLTLVGTMLVNALCAPASVRLARSYADGSRSQFFGLTLKLILIAAALGAVGILVSAFAGARILTLLYTSEYAPMSGVLTVLCVAGAISYICFPFGYAMTALRRYKVQVPIFLTVVLVTLLSCYLLTKRYGLMGTAIGILLGNLAQLLLSAWVVGQTHWHPPSGMSAEAGEIISDGPYLEPTVG